MNSKPINEIKIRKVIDRDLQVYFEQQLDPDANEMAAFTSKNPADREAFNTKWKKILADKTITLRTILFNDVIAGHVVSHSWFGEPEVSYWLGKEFWGKGIATESLRLFLDDLKQRPLFARVAIDNAGSMRVLEKCGFVVTGNDKGFANARSEEVEEIVYKIN